MSSIKNKILLLSLFTLLLLVLVVWEIVSESNSKESIKTEENTISNFTPNTVPPGSESKYDIKFKMNEEGVFHLESKVTIKNTSNDSWDELVFYFIPNIFTESNSQELNNSVKVPSSIQLHKVIIEDKQASYNLKRDTLSIPLTNEIEPGNEVSVAFTYDFTLPEKGLRFTKNNGNYYLAQFYPMVPTYREGQWNKEDYRLRGETYHTAFSDFKVSYDLPHGYTLVSTSENDTYPSKVSGSFEVDKVKEVFIAVLAEPKVIQKSIPVRRIFGDLKKKEPSWYDTGCQIVHRDDP
ncbi:hypothetical protein BKP35_17435 [Anaerobacillus arseniciselenatis]|uniref:Uncharacterized protein n=1 Tax=Anaerobacillus arseniciselenatis TaxID=85682 RepID=A0A1S2L8X7_9BACI|nr:hypothetical protein [Anaerobacillus arseniciselenatis]OIJ08806.1 hypothetical protein BKP35_17435 [Anaerobacillus arseniciselenatis]